MDIFINSTLIPASDASVSVSERGFKFGDGVFETIAVHSGKMHLFPFHLERLGAGLQAVRITYDISALEADCQTLLTTNNIHDGLLRIYISRGQGGRGYVPDPQAPPLVVIEAMPHVFVLPEPAKLWLSGYEKISPRALPVESKIAQGMQATLAMLEAGDHGCGDALLLNASGHITETTCGNIFWLKNDILYTPAAECGLLPGSTRHLLMQLSPWQVKQGAYGIEALASAEAVIVTNCRVKAMPVAMLLPTSGKWDSLTFARQCYELLISSATSRARKSG